ncbi:TraR/DksA C4-type zinc finger protein [Alicyclobacillus fodiniaquatilis]|uniref:TraR/DksA C4-type zinc finger protein n=1 Tax=Alicyclobacillus fodiniaquatilis TaxID=1661150 RepID=A0ABW4JMH0_9BACL
MNDHGNLIPGTVSAMRYEQIRDTLIRTKQDVEERLAHAENARLNESMRDQFSELSFVDNHPADVASEVYLRGLDVGQRVRDEAHLADIDSALSAMENGTYGTCEKCQQPIDTERLMAMPTARLCLTCQRHEERLNTPHRPVEEEVLAPGFGQYDLDEKDATGFDAEDSYQAVARYNIGSGGIDSNDHLNDMDDNEGIVDEMDRISQSEYEDQLP